MEQEHTSGGTRRTGRARADIQQQVLVRLARLGPGDGDMSALLRRVADLAVQATGTRAASAVLGDPADPVLLVSTSPSAQAADGMQYMSGTGPLFEAYRTGRTVTGRSAAPDGAGPAEPANVTRTRSWLAAPIRLAEQPAGVLMLYGDVDDIDAGTADLLDPFVAAAATLIRDRRTLDQLARTCDQLREALASRAVIDQAKGMIMRERRCSADEAFGILVQVSNDSNRKVRDLAAALVDSGGELRADGCAG